jgi:phosphoribosyl 1,2-cyclic phosphodiesterase
MKLKEIVFIGTGGGRGAVIRQPKDFGTGGFRINGDLNIYVDPGPGAAAHSARLGHSLEDIDILIISHNHLDHMGDAEVLAEAMNGFGFEKKGILIASDACINGSKGDKCDRAMDRYHMDMFKDIIIGKPGKKMEIEKNEKSFEIEFTPVDHEDGTGFGFVIKAENATVGYTSDTQYTKGMEKWFMGVDALIINAIKENLTETGKSGKPYAGHLAFYPDAERIIGKVRPDLSILTHIGYRLATGGRLEELKYDLNSKTGEQVMIPRQGYKVSLSNPLMFPKKHGLIKKGK